MTELTEAERISSYRDHPGSLLWRSGEAGQAAADVLFDYEKNNEVTFAALDNTALQRIREAWESDDDDELHSAINDLLGLSD